MTQCTDDAEFMPESQPATDIVQSSAESDDPVLSLTVDGVFTEYASVLDCKTCDYIVPRNASIVDGKELGIKPGQAICLDSKISYGNLEIINLIGEEDKPITVAYSMVLAKPEAAAGDE